MSGIDMQSLLKLNNQDFEMIIEGLEALKSKDFAGELMSHMFDSIVAPKKDADPETLRKWEEHKKEEAAKEELKKEAKKEMMHKIEVLKSKLILISDNMSNSAN